MQIGRHQILHFPNGEGNFHLDPVLRSRTRNHRYRCCRQYQRQFGRPIRIGFRLPKTYTLLGNFLGNRIFQFSHYRYHSPEHFPKNPLQLLGENDNQTGCCRYLECPILSHNSRQEYTSQREYCLLQTSNLYQQHKDNPRDQWPSPMVQWTEYLQIRTIPMSSPVYTARLPPPRVSEKVPR